MSNKIFIHGRLTADPEIKTTQSGVAVCKFSVASDRSFTRQGEERQSDFFNVIAWRGLAEVISKHFTKGKEIIVHGEMQSRTYTDKDEVKRLVWEVQAGSIEFCGTKGASQNDTAKPYSQENNYSDMEEAATDEDLPF